jgi:ATP-binding cassette, subfamily B, heavy metal transporter
MIEFLKTLRTFYAFIARRRFFFVLFLLSTVVYSALYSSIPYFFKLFTDSLQDADYQRLHQLLFLFIGIRVTSLIVETASYYLGDVVQFDAAVNARKKVFKHIQDLDFAFHANKSTGYLISAIKRGDGAFWALSHSIHHRLLEVVVAFIVMLYFLSGLHPSITLVVFASFVLAFAMTKFLIKLNMKARQTHNSDEDNVTSIIVDNLVNFETVKLFAKETKEQKRLDEGFADWLKSGWRYVNTFRIIDISLGTLINISIFLILYIGLNRFEGNTLTVGEFVLVLGFVNSFYPRLFDLVWSFRDIAKHYTDIQKYFGILDNAVKIKDPAKPVLMKKVKGEIVYKNVSFSYKGGKRNAIRGLNLRIRQGQSVALVGRSGSGKTTFIKLLMRFYDVDSGVVALDGVDIKKMTKSHLRSFMGVVPQEPVLFNNSIAYNIGYGKDGATTDEVRAAAKLANLDDFIQTLTNKYGTDVGERGIKLSGGQKQRLAIARMILSEPDIIIFDEATSQLDSENEALIQEAFWKAVKNKTTIIIAHRLSTAMRADKIVVMENGHIVETGSHKELLTKDESLYKYFWELQTR